MLLQILAPGAALHAYSKQLCACEVGGFWPLMIGMWLIAMCYHGLVGVSALTCCRWFGVGLMLAGVFDADQLLCQGPAWHSAVSCSGLLQWSLLCARIDVAFYSHLSECNTNSFSG
jgi:hypothetical protein